MTVILNHSKSKSKQGIKLEFWEHAVIAKPDCLKVQSCCHIHPLFVGFSLQEITRYNDFELSLYTGFSFVPRLAWLFHGLNVIRLCDNCFKTTELKTVEEEFANLTHVYMLF